MKRLIITLSFLVSMAYAEKFEYGLNLGLGWSYEVYDSAGKGVNIGDYSRDYLGLGDTLTYVYSDFSIFNLDMNGKYYIYRIFQN